MVEAAVATDEMTASDQWCDSFGIRSCPSSAVR